MLAYMYNLNVNLLKIDPVLSCQQTCKSTQLKNVFFKRVH